MRTWISQMRKGLVELTVLAALAHGEAYGYELLRRINGVQGLTLKESTLYPLLARLTEEKVLQVRSEASRSGPPRRYYQLTSSGRLRLQKMMQYWDEVQAAVAKLLSGVTP